MMTRISLRLLDNPFTHALRNSFVSLHSQVLSISTTYHFPMYHYAHSPLHMPIIPRNHVQHFLVLVYFKTISSVPVYRSPYAPVTEISASLGPDVIPE